MLNKNKLRGKIAEAGMTVASLAAAIGLNPATLHRKINGETEFTRAEIQTITEVLNLTVEEVQEIFFARKLA